MSRAKRTREQVISDRLKRAKELGDLDPRDPNVVPPPGAVMADAKALAHNNTYGCLPRFYIDKVVVCRQCGKEEVWPGERQKWWYEEVKGNINTQAVLCRSCRKVEKQRKDEARRIHLGGLKK